MTYWEQNYILEKIVKFDPDGKQVGASFARCYSKNFLLEGLFCSQQNELKYGSKHNNHTKKDLYGFFQNNKHLGKYDYENMFDIDVTNIFKSIG